jgi:hypothetical protein
MNKMEKLKKNIGKQAIVRNSELPFLIGQQGKIVDVNGSDRVGYRYTMEFPKPLLGTLDTFYPPTFLVDVL